MVAIDTPRYARTAHALWRDTGRHVVVLPPGEQGKVLVIGGGGGAVWRLLDRPRSLCELIDHFGHDVGAAPDLASLTDCLEQLRGRGVLQISADET